MVILRWGVWTVTVLGAVIVAVFFTFILNVCSSHAYVGHYGVRVFIEVIVQPYFFIVY